jgi:NADH dehydrogenase
MNRIFVLGGGIAGMSVARALRFAPVNVTLVEHENFQKFRGQQPNLRIVSSEALFVDARAKRVILRENTHPYDFLVVATGLENHYARPEWAELMKQQPMAPVTVIGGGVRGVELAWQMSKEHRTVLVEQCPRLLPDFSEFIAALTTERLIERGVDVRCNRFAIGMDRDSVRLSGPEGREKILSRAIAWAGERKAGAIGQAVAEETGVRSDEKGRIFVNPDLSIPGCPEIFVAGDLAVHPWCGLSTAASQQGRYVAEAIRARLAGYKVPPFEYVDQGRFVVLGRWAAGVINETEVTGLTARFLQMAGTASSTWNARFRPVITTSPRNLCSPFSSRSRGRSSG